MPSYVCDKCQNTDDEKTVCCGNLMVERIGEVPKPSKKKNKGEEQ